MKLRKPTLLLFSTLCLLLLAVPSLSFANFKLVVIGDTQNHQSQTASLTTSIVGMSDVAFVAQMGDVVNTCGESYLNQSNAYNTLDNADIPYGVAEGNHDSSCAGFATYFGASRYSGSLYPGGYYRGSYDDRDHYFFFSAEGLDFIIIFLKYSPGASQLAWANNLLAANPNRRGIVVSHNIISYNDAWVNQNTYSSLSANPNLFLMLCGHMHIGTDGEAFREETRTGMQSVYILMTDYQDFGSNVLRTITFTPASDSITFAHSQGTGSTFSKFYDMALPLAGDFDPEDCDVDGSDLAALVANQSLIDLSIFSGNFGKNICP